MKRGCMSRTEKDSVFEKCFEKHHSDSFVVLFF